MKWGVSSILFLSSSILSGLRSTLPASASCSWIRSLSLTIDPFPCITNDVWEEVVFHDGVSDVVVIDNMTSNLQINYVWSRNNLAVIPTVSESKLTVLACYISCLLGVGPNTQKCVKWQSKHRKVGQFSVTVGSVHNNKEKAIQWRISRLRFLCARENDQNRLGIIVRFLLLLLRWLLLLLP